MDKPLKFYDARTKAALDDLRDLEDRHYRIYVDSFSDKVHHVAEGVTKTNAEFILRACNSHNDLLKALEFIYEQYLEAVDGIEEYRFKNVEQAIDKAKE